MSDEAQSGLAPSEPAGDKLDSIISSAIEQAESGSNTDPPAGDEAAPEIKEDKSGRLHAKDGKFVAKKDAAAEASDKEPAEAVTADASKTAPDPAQVQPVEAPARWTADEKAIFATWPRDVQVAVAERQKAMEADYTRKTQEAAEIRKAAEPFLNALKPYEGYLAQLSPILGKQPHQLVAELIGVEHRLRTGSDVERYQAFQTLAQTYGIDLAALAGGQVPQPDPAYQQLASRLAAFEQRDREREAQQQQQQAQQTALQIDSFSQAKDEAGRPRYPHFERVRGVMAAALLNGEATTLEGAYQKAIEPINAAIAEELKSRQQQVDTQRKEAVAKAEKAAPVRSSGSQPGGTAQSKGLDSIIESAMATHGM